MTQIKIEHVSLYTIYSNGRASDSSYTTAIRLKHGRDVRYLVPVGIDWECDGGHEINEISESELLKTWSLTAGSDSGYRGK